MKLGQMFRALFAAIVLASCAPVDVPAQEGPMEITLRRSACFGFCPDYTVTINGEGQVRYEGRGSVNVVGQRTATIPAEDVARLAARFDEIGFEQLRDEYRANITDIPTYTVSITRNGHTKTVVDYGGQSAGMPRAVSDLQREIDRVAGTAQWVMRDGQAVRDMPTKG